MATATPYPRQRVPQRLNAGRGPYDAAVIGGGPAGLSAAIYLARFNRRVVMLDEGEGRSTARQVNENYLGFPRGIAARDLRRKGIAQASRFGADCAEGFVSGIRREDGVFAIRCGRRVFRARAIILATGVIDQFPRIPNTERYVGHSLFWCITCDGWKTRGKRLLLVGNDDEAATTALQFLNYTDRVTMLTNSARTAISEKKRRALARAGVTLHRAELAKAGGRGGNLRWVETDAGERLDLDIMFSMQGSEPNIALAKRLRLKLKDGYIAVDKEQRTSKKGVYAAGDVTKQHAHQVVTAAHEGATAAQALNYDLYRPEQKE